MMDLVQRVNWDEYLQILSQGSPPIGLQLLLVNAVLMAYLLHRRTRKGKNRQAGWMLPVVIIGGNLVVVTWGGQLAF